MDPGREAMVGEESAHELGLQTPCEALLINLKFRDKSIKTFKMETIGPF